MLQALQGEGIIFINANNYKQKTISVLFKILFKVLYTYWKVLFHRKIDLVFYI